ncbi:MAG: glycine-rich domain-containing protein [Cyanobium sp.]
MRTTLQPVSPQDVPLARPDLHGRLQAWCLDPPGSELTFAGKLARENLWTSDHAARVIAEYRRFLYQAVAAGHPVCPPDAIDQAWHQHLLDTRGYWDEFCPQVLGQALHHSPSKGRPGEEQMLRDWYDLTLRSYWAAFGEPPPADLWPSTEERFRGEERWQRVDGSRYRLVARHRRLGPKPPWLRPGRLRQFITGSTLLDLGGVGLLLLAIHPLFLLLVLVLVLVLVAAVARRKRSQSGTNRNRGRGGNSSDGGAGCGGSGSGCGGGGCGGCGGGGGCGG